jgi:GGDEF domain-containing protein
MPLTQESAGSDTQLGAWKDSTCSVLEAMSAHVFRCNPSEYDRFRQKVTETLETWKGQPSSSAVLISTGILTQHIEQYYQDTQRRVDGSMAELHDIAGILLSFVSSLCAPPLGGDASTSSSLLQIGEMMQQASTAEELRKVKLDLTGKLQGFKEPERTPSAETVTNQRLPAQPSSQPSPQPSPQPSQQPSPQPSQQHAATWNPSPAPEDVLDPLTGLPNRMAAANAILGLKSSPNGAYLVAFYVQRMPHFNARLGDRIGNELLFLSAQCIANALLRPGDQLFRWRGPAFVALIKREDTLIDVKREIKRVLASGFQFELRGGAMLVKPSIVTEAVSAGTSDCADLMQDVEKFFSLHAAT